MNKLFLVVLIVLLSCAGIAYNRTPLALPQIAPLTLRPVGFTVIMQDECQTAFDQEPVLIAVTFDDYKSMSMNTNEMKRYIILQGQQIEAYKEYYERD